MREHALTPHRVRAWLATTNSDHKQLIYPNLRSSITPEGPDELWVADLTYIRLTTGFVFLAVVLDAWSRRVIGYAISHLLDTRLCLAALDAALDLRQPRAGLVHHSDRGVQGEFKRSSQHLRKEEELRWRQASADGRIELCVRRWVHPVVPRWGAGSIGRGFGKKLLEGCRARSRRWQPACLPLLGRAGFANVVACHLSVFVLCRGATYRSSSEKRLRFFKPAVVEGREVVYVWADGIYVKAGLERDKAALLVVLGAMRDGTKEVLALRSGYRESVESWSEVLRDLKARGIEAPRLLMADGNAAIWGAVRQVWPEAGEQRCWNHKMRNVLDRLPQREQSEAKDLLRAVVYAPSRAEAVKAREVFARRYRPWYPKAVDVLEDDWERMVAFYDFPEDHWKHLRTTNVVESPFAALRLRTTAEKRFKRVESATALIWKLLLVAEKRFRRLDAPHLLKDVFEGRKFEDGKPVSTQQRKNAA